jgi:hypothetical protein
MVFDGTGTENDDAIEHLVRQVKDTVAGLLSDARPAHERRVKPLPLLGGDT